MGEELHENTVKIVPIHNKHVLFSNELQIPINPMIGVIELLQKKRVFHVAHRMITAGIWTVKR